MMKRKEVYNIVFWEFGKSMCTLKPSSQSECEQFKLSCLTTNQLEKQHSIQCIPRKLVYSFSFLFFKLYKKRVIIRKQSTFPIQQGFISQKRFQKGHYSSLDLCIFCAILWKIINDVVHQDTFDQEFFYV